MVDLPQEVLMEILAKLPVESLVRFKCVCKCWYALLENPKFVSKHMVNHSNDHVVILKENTESYYYSLSFLSNIGNDGVDVPCTVDLDLDLKYPFNEACGMYGYCDGVVLLTNDVDKITLCNPTIRDIRNLPKSPSFLAHTTGENPLHAMIIATGFGYDPKTNDYKVVRVLAFLTYEDDSIQLPDRAEVFSLRTDSTWREVKGNDGVTPSSSDVLEQYFNGVQYWCGLYEHNQKGLIVSFDMADEVFQKASIPDVCGYMQVIKSMGVFRNESIALCVGPSYNSFFDPSYNSEGCIDVWVMKEFGKKESWTKKFTIGPVTGLDRPLVFWKNDKELLLEDRRNKQLVSYELNTQESKILPINLKNCGYDLLGAYSFKKTLVSVNNRGT